MADMNREPRSIEAAVTPTKSDGTAIPADSTAEHRELARVAEYILADCFFAVGQTIGMRLTVDYVAVVWWHDHFRAKFVAALRRHGNRWAQDRESVTAVGWMLAERAVRHAAGRDSIDVEAARRAAADVERYCQHRAQRQALKGNSEVRQAGLWCIPWPC